MNFIVKKLIHENRQSRFDREDLLTCTSMFPCFLLQVFLFSFLFSCSRLQYIFSSISSPFTDLSAGKLYSFFLIHLTLYHFFFQYLLQHQWTQAFSYVYSSILLNLKDFHFLSKLSYQLFSIYLSLSFFFYPLIFSIFFRSHSSFLLLFLVQTLFSFLYPPCFTALPSLIRHFRYLTPSTFFLFIYFSQHSSWLYSISWLMFLILIFLSNFLSFSPEFIQTV